MRRIKISEQYRFFWMFLHINAGSRMVGGSVKKSLLEYAMMSLDLTKYAVKSRTPLLL